MHINTRISYLKVQSNAGQEICTDDWETWIIRKIYNTFLSTLFSSRNVGTPMINYRFPSIFFILSTFILMRANVSSVLIQITQFSVFVVVTSNLRPCNLRTYNKTYYTVLRPVLVKVAIPRLHWKISVVVKYVICIRWTHTF